MKKAQEDTEATLKVIRRGRRYWRLRYSSNIDHIYTHTHARAHAHAHTHTHTHARACARNIILYPGVSRCHLIQKPKKTSVYIAEIKKQNWIKFPIICEIFCA